MKYGIADMDMAKKKKKCRTVATFLFKGMSTEENVVEWWGIKFMLVILRFRKYLFINNIKYNLLFKIYHLFNK